MCKRASSGEAQLLVQKTFVSDVRHEGVCNRVEDVLNQCKRVLLYFLARLGLVKAQSCGRLFLNMPSSTPRSRCICCKWKGSVHCAETIHYSRSSELLAQDVGARLKFELKKHASGLLDVHVAQSVACKSKCEQIRAAQPYCDETMRHLLSQNRGLALQYHPDKAQQANKEWAHTKWHEIHEMFRHLLL